jgi:hypothetical protein
VLQAERRRRGDLVAAAAVVAVVAIGIVVVVVFSPAAHTESITAKPPLTAVPATPPDVPATLTEAWRAPSAASNTPLALGPAVVTADGSTVIGHDPLTGQRRWSYRRNLPLCTLGANAGMALAVYRNGDYCSEVTALMPDTGARGPQRNSDVRPGTRLVSDGYLVTATGPHHLETWRSDLVKTMEYGRLRAPTEPGTQVRPDCLHASVAITTWRLAVLERCPGEPGDRLTLLRPGDDEAEEPNQEFSVVLPTTGARVVAVAPDRVAVLLPNPARLSIRGGDGAELASYPLDLPAGDLAGDPPGEVTPTTALPGAILWWTGSRTIALDASDLHPMWTLPGALGPGTLMAGRALIPIPAGLSVVNPADGAVQRTIPVDRRGYQGSVTLSALGPVVLEQRGPVVVALR